MAYIYKITNDVNGKVYIGKTNYSIEKRFKEHCQDYKRIRCEKRPLYSAMQKYGIEHFHIELLEETEKPEDREIYWIAQYDSYHNGYNATHGGDGKQYLDYDKIIETYQTLQNVTRTAEICKVSRDQVSNILKSQNIDIKSAQMITKELCQKQVGMYDIKTLKLVKVFSSVRDAARFVIINISNSKLGGVSSHIAGVCCGKRKSAYGYIWKYQ